MVTQIDVCLACYNGGRYLPALLASLRAQDEPSFRVLMQDDGSTDDTPALLAAAQAADARFIPAAEQGRHLGAVGNFLSLIRQSDAPYTALCDQDDVWHADKLSACRAAMARAEAEYGSDTPLLVHSDAALVDADGAPLHPSFFAHQGWDGSTVTLAPLLVQNNVTGCTLLMNAPLRRLVAAHGTPEAMFMHDWFIALTAAAFGQIVFLPRALVDYRQHGTNVMGASKGGQLARFARALSLPRQVRERIALTYRHTRAFAASYPALPDEARHVIDAYLTLPETPKLTRWRTLRRLGCLMQSPLTRLAQLLFT